MRRRWEDWILEPLGLTRLELALLAGLLIGFVGALLLILTTMDCRWIR